MRLSITTFLVGCLPSSQLGYNMVYCQTSDSYTGYLGVFCNIASTLIHHKDTIKDYYSFSSVLLLLLIFSIQPVRHSAQCLSAFSPHLGYFIIRHSSLLPAGTGHGGTTFYDANRPNHYEYGWNELFWLQNTSEIYIFVYILCGYKHSIDALWMKLISISKKILGIHY